jgi:hypothetical protein
VEVPSGEDNVTKKSAGDDARVGGASSVEPIAPNPIRSNAPRQIDLSIVDWAASTNLLLADVGASVPCPFPSGNKHFLQ